MAKKKTTKKSLSTAQKVGIGVGLTTAAVTAAGAYFLYGSKNASKNRKAVKSWVLKAKAEVLEALEDAKEMTQEEYETLVDGIAAAYAAVKSSTNGEVAAFKKEMKGYWNHIKKTAPMRKCAPKKKAAKKAVKKATKKVAKKAAKKTARRKK